MQKFLQVLLICGSAQLVTLEKWNWPANDEPREDTEGDSISRSTTVNLSGDNKNCQCIQREYCLIPSFNVPNPCSQGVYCCGPNLRRQDYQHQNAKFIGKPTIENDVLVGPGGPTGKIGPPLNQRQESFFTPPRREDFGSNLHNRDILVGPNGPTGVIGPFGGKHFQSGLNNHKDVLVGPGGPTGVIGPDSSRKHFQSGFNDHKDVLVGPGGPTGVIGPDSHSAIKRQKDILVGPGGPTGIIGPHGLNKHDKAVLVGPGGPTGIIGPNYLNNYNTGFSDVNQRYTQNKGILVGPGGPTGSIGPYSHNKRRYRPGYNNNGGRPVLVGPGGPTGVIGPGGNYQSRGILVGPGGPTGQIGPKYGLLSNQYNRPSYY